MRSDSSWSNKLRQIGPYEREDHHFLGEMDYCAYFGEYTPAKGTGKASWSLSETNSIISNLKKHVAKKDTREWHFKQQAIKDLGILIRNNIKPDWLNRVTFVPAPPSKAVSDPEYDSRMFDVAKAMGDDVDVRSLLTTSQSRVPLHTSQEFRSVERVLQNIRIDTKELEKKQPAKTIIILDDLIVTGSTFVACKRLLLQTFEDVNVLGLFIARRVPLRNDEDL